MEKLFHVVSFLKYSQLKNTLFFSLALVTKPKLYLFIDIIIYDLHVYPTIHLNGS